MTAAEFQQAFWRDLWSRDSPHGSPWSRQPGFAVYRNTVLKGCVDNLIALYPAVHRLTGDGWFSAMALSYAHKHPPTDARMACYGGGFPAFLAQHLADGELPWLPDVAQLDALWSQCHVAADAPLLAPETLTRPSDFCHRPISLVLHPATRWHACSAWPALSLWRAAREAWPDPNPPAWQGECTLFTRPHGAVLAHEVGPGVCALLEACARQEPLTAAVTCVSDREPDLDLGATLGLLFTMGAFTRVTS